MHRKRFLVLVASWLALSLSWLLAGMAPWGATALLGLPHGVYVTLFACVLPNFFAGFLAAAWLLRILAGAVGGSDGGGHRVPATARN